MTDWILRRAGGMGDLLMALGAAKALRLICPSGKVGIETAHEYAELVAMCPWTSDTVGPDAIRVDLSSVKYGRAQMHQIDAYLNGCQINPQAIPSKYKSIDLEFPRTPKQRYICIHPHAVDPNRTYPFWLEVVDMLISRGHEVRTVGDHNSLLESLQTIDGASCFVSADSGPIQLAGATDTPIVGIYSVVSGVYRLPFRERARSLAIHGNCPSINCYSRMGEKALWAGLTGTPAELFGNWCPEGDFRCMTTLTPGHVVTAVEMAMSNA